MSTPPVPHIIEQTPVGRLQIGAHGICPHAEDDRVIAAQIPLRQIARREHTHVLPEILESPGNVVAGAGQESYAQSGRCLDIHSHGPIRRRPIEGIQAEAVITREPIAFLVGSPAVFG